MIVNVKSTFNYNGVTYCFRQTFAFMEADSPTLHIPFSLEPGVRCDVLERFAFWYSTPTKLWFKNHGYVLYDYATKGGSTWPSLPSAETQYPYARFDTHVYEGVPPLRALDESGKIVYAQDTSNRHVAIKLVRADTDEYRILRFLSQQPLEILKENCIIPVLDLLPIEGFWLAVMPRWGTSIVYPPLTHLCEAIDLFHSMLKGLAFLHSNNILHRDITVINVLVDYFSDMVSIDDKNDLRQLRQQRSLSYALCDFDFSVMLPNDADRDQIRLPYQKSWDTWDSTGDTTAGDYEYDPFIFDVGNLGATFCRFFQHLSQNFPALAPLLDMMTTWELQRRFTATEALDFFEKHLSELSEDQMYSTFARAPPTRRYDTYDRWQHLPPDLVERWKMYKVAPEPWTRRLLCALCRRKWWWHIVPWTRWFFFQVFSDLPRRSYRWFLPSKVRL